MPPPVASTMRLVGAALDESVRNTDGSFDDFGIGSAYGDALQVTDRAADCPVGGEGEGAPMFGGDIGDFDDDEGCAIATLAEIEADEEFAFERVAQVLRDEIVVCRGRYGRGRRIRLGGPGLAEDGVGRREELAHVFLAEVVRAEVAEFLCEEVGWDAGAFVRRDFEARPIFAVDPFAIEEAALAVGRAEEPDGAAA